MVSFEDTTQKLIQIFRRHFQKSSQKLIRQMATNFYFLCSGIKPSFLLDANPFAGNASYQDKSELLQKVLEDVSALVAQDRKGSICGMLIQDDVVIFNLETLTVKLNSLLKEKMESILLIDISRDINSPKVLIDDSVLSDTVSLISDILNQISNSGSKCFELKLGPDCNITTVFGILLCYPVVYYYKDVQNCENCLSQTELFSCKLLTKIGSGSIEDQLVYGFSYPVLLESDANPHVESWRNNIVSNFCDLELIWRKTVVNLDTVVL